MIISLLIKKKNKRFFAKGFPFIYFTISVKKIYTIDFSLTPYWTHQYILLALPS